MTEDEIAEKYGIPREDQLKIQKVNLSDRLIISQFNEIMEKFAKGVTKKLSFVENHLSIIEATSSNTKSEVNIFIQGTVAWRHEKIRREDEIERHLNDKIDSLKSEVSTLSALINANPCGEHKALFKVLKDEKIVSRVLDNSRFLSNVKRFGLWFVGLFTAGHFGKDTIVDFIKQLIHK